jgi:chromosome segregation ATPase
LKIEFFSRYLQARLQEELAESKSTISAMESQRKVKTDEWIAGECRLKEEKMKLQEQLSNLSKELDSTKEKQVHLQKLFDDANREITDWQNKCHHLESKMSELEKHNLLQVSRCSC